MRSLDLLIADDHAANRMVLQRLLQKAGHRVASVEDGEQVLDALAANSYDAAIVDLHMPGVSGLDLMRELRVMEAGGGKRTPVIVLTADVTPEAIQRCAQAGARAFLPKPVVAARLLDTLAEVATPGRPNDRSRPRASNCRWATTISTPACWRNSLARHGRGVRARVHRAVPARRGQPLHGDWRSPAEAERLGRRARPRTR